MPKEMLMEKAASLREIADSLEAYASEMEGEETVEGEESSPEAYSSESSEPSTGGGDKIKMALAGMKKGMK